MRARRTKRDLIADMQAAGFMFQNAAPANRYTMQVRGFKSGKLQMIAAIRFYVIAPLSSPLGKAMDGAAKAKLRKTATPRRRR